MQSSFNPNTEKTQQVISEADAAFLKQILQQMEDIQETLKEQYDDLSSLLEHHRRQRSFMWLSPEVSQAAGDLPAQIDRLSAHIATARKIQNNQVITLAEQQSLLGNGALQNTIVARYAQVVEDKNTPKPF